jgi:hypothetical protein
VATKYRCTVNFELETQIEPEGVERQFDTGNVSYDDYEDNSYFSTQSVECDGGSVSFTVEVDDEDAARERAEEVIFDGQEFEDSNDFTWVVTSVNYDVEAIEWEPTVEEAIEVLMDFVNSHIGDGTEEGQGRVAKAAQVVLDDHARLGQRVESLETRVADLDSRISQLSQRLSDAEASKSTDTAEF